MKILIIAATPFFSDRGCHVRIYNQSTYLKKIGADVKICTYFGGENIEGLDIERIKKVSWYKKTVPGFSWGKFWLDWKMIFLCRRVIRDFQPDIIHAYQYEGLGIGYIAKLIAFYRLPIVIDLQGLLDEEFRNYNRRNFIARKIFVWLSKRLIHRSDWLVLSSENLLPYMEKIVRDKNDISIVQDGIDLDLFRNLPPLSDQDMQKIEEVKEWNGGRKLLVYIGGLSDNKGVGELLKGFKIFAEHDEEWNLLLGGFGDDERKYKEFVEENNLSSRVFFAGRVNYFSLPVYLSLAQAAVDPKTGSTEGSGKLINLMCAGLPIICFDNEFNRARVGDRGLFITNLDDLGNILRDFDEASKIDYELDSFDEKLEVKKLLAIMKPLIRKKGKE